MTLTVRLPLPLEKSLDAYCAEHGLTKSHVVQECLATYLVQARTDRAAAQPRSQVSPAYAAFKRAGLIGAADLGSASATREAVRQRARQRLQRGGA
jgi:hypothetical protein